MLLESKFFDRPLWQQYLLMVSTVLIVLLVGYHSLIKEEQEIAKQYQEHYQQNLIALKQLEAQLITSKRSDRDPVKKLSEQRLAKLYSEHKLQLQTFAISETATTVNWQLVGDYQNFVALLSRLISERYYFDLRHLLIEKRESEQLQITFTVALTDS